MNEPASARTLRRHTNRIESQTQAVLQRLDNLLDRLAEQAERLRQIEADIERMQKYTGIIARHSKVPHVPTVESATALMARV